MDVRFECMDVRCKCMDVRCECMDVRYKFLHDKRDTGGFPRRADDARRQQRGERI
jgi:hypothetical protein